MSKLINLTGKQFGNLKVLSKAQSKNGRTMWNCRCGCGKEIEVLASNLVRGNSKSCGCLKEKYISEAKTEDITGKRFGKLLVLRKSDRKSKNSYWICECECGTVKEICATALRNGQKSCGCSAFDFAKDKVIGNEYTVDENNVVHAILRTGDEMLCDMDDWEKLKDFTWTKDKWGYASASINRKRKKFHVEVMGKKSGYVIDHADQNKLNNRRNNLRFLTKSGNGANSKLSKNNTSSIKGVTKTRNGKWTASLMLNRKHIHLGTFDTIEEAAEARAKGEEKYFKPLFENIKG